MPDRRGENCVQYVPCNQHSEREGERGEGPLLDAIAKDTAVQLQHI